MEQNTRECKQCEQLKQRIEAGKFPNGKNKRWRDESGKLWSGNLCGECNNARCKEAVKKTRYENKREN